MFNPPYSTKRIAWTDAYFYACSSGEHFKDVRVVTAKGEFITKVNDLVDTLWENAHLCSEQAERHLTEQVISEMGINVQEHVTIDEAGISVCINAENVNDENTMLRTLDMVTDALDQLNGKQGTVSFGDPLTFSINDITWLTKQ